MPWLVNCGCGFTGSTAHYKQGRELAERHCADMGRSSHPARVIGFVLKSSRLPDHPVTRLRLIPSKVASR